MYLHDDPKYSYSRLGPSPENLAELVAVGPDRLTGTGSAPPSCLSVQKREEAKIAKTKIKNDARK